MDQGTGISFAHDSGYFSSIVAFSIAGVNRPAVDVTTYADAGARIFDPSDVWDPGQVTVQIQFDPATLPSLLAGDAKETGTITWSNAAGTTWAADAFMVDFSVETGMEERNLADCTLQISGDWVVTP